jgi:hypothetical protein
LPSELVRYTWDVSVGVAVEAVMDNITATASVHVQAVGVAGANTHLLSDIHNGADVEVQKAGVV